MRLFINNVDYTKNLIIPIKLQHSLDEALDQGIITLKNMAESEPFEPLSLVEFGEFRFLVGVDKVVLSIYGKNPKYTHEILLIEETKYLEKFFVDTCTFTNSLLKSYVEKGASRVSLSQNYFEKYEAEIANAAGNIGSTGNNFGYWQEHSEVYPDLVFTDDYILSPVTVQGSAAKSYNVPRIFGLYSSNITINSTAPENRDLFVIEVKNLNNGNIEYLNISNSASNISFTAKQGNIYSISIGIVRTIPISPSIFNNILYFGDYYIVGFEKTGDEFSDITITNVVNRILQICETKRYGENARFVFNAEQAEKYSKVLAPEFAITKSTLREALQQVGNYIHAMPRLVGNEIFFDDLGKIDYAKLPKEFITYEATQDIEQFCSEIDSNVDNLVNIDDEQSGTIVEPFNNGWKTPRVDVGVVDIQQNNAFFETTKPIEKIVKVELGYLSNNTFIGDITPFVYEQSEYSVLDSYDGVYPYSKAYAIYYTQGKNNIYGLNFEEEDAVSSVFRNPAILNIINAVKNSNYGLDSMVKLQYRITYIPIISARVKQRKPYLNSTTKKSVLAYNASANKVDTDYYGENLKGAVARLGNIEKTMTYIVNSFDEIPKVGKLYNKDYFISVVKSEIYNNYIKVTIGLSRDFNRLNQYIGVDNNQRFYEVSEKQSVERYALYEDYLIVGDDFPIESEEENQSLITDYMLLGVLRRFGTSNTAYYLQEEISCFKLIGKDDNLNVIGEPIILPCVSFALGNSAFFQISYNNNFGAGTYIQSFLTNSKGVQSEAEYGDGYGNLKYLDVIGYTRPYNIEWNYNEAVNVGSKLPKVVKETTAPAFIHTAEAPIYIDKDNREIINFGYQIHCLTNKDNIIVGSGLSKKLMISKYDNDNVDVYIMQREIGKFEKEILDLPSENMKLTGQNQSVDYVNKKISFGSIICNTNGKSVIMVDRKTKELIFAVNEDVSYGQEYILPSLMFRHKIYN